MISFKEYLLEAFGDSTKHYKAIQSVERALDQATRPINVSTMPRGNDIWGRSFAFAQDSPHGPKASF